MSRHSGPDHRLPPSDQRCEAMVRGIPHYHWEWQRVDHRCPRKANQGRAGRLVCYQHATAKRLRFYTGETMSDTPQDKASRKVLVDVIDCTPTWKELVPALITMVRDGSAETATIGAEQLMRMATAADAYNRAMHRMQDALRTGEQAMAELRARVEHITKETPDHGA